MKYLKCLALSVLLMLSTSAYCDEDYNWLIKVREHTAGWILSEHPQYVHTFTEASKLADLVLYHSVVKGLQPDVVAVLASYESKYNTRAVSKTGAKGIMQVMPKYHQDKLNGRNPFDVSANIEVGSTILRDCLNKRGGNLRSALTCYSGYEGRMARQFQEDVLTRLSDFRKQVNAASKVATVLNEYELN